MHYASGFLAVAVFAAAASAQAPGPKWVDIMMPKGWWVDTSRIEHTGADTYRATVRNVILKDTTEDTDEVRCADLGVRTVRHHAFGPGIRVQKNGKREVIESSPNDPFERENPKYENSMKYVTLCEIARAKFGVHVSAVPGSGARRP